MANSQRQKKTVPPIPPIGQIWADFKSLKRRFEEMRSTVAKLKDILQVQDNWHSRVSKWIGKEVQADIDTGVHLTDAKLLWTDRYNVGLEVKGKERLYNKGHIVWIGPA